VTGVRGGGRQNKTKPKMKNKPPLLSLIFYLSKKGKLQNRKERFSPERRVSSVAVSLFPEKHKSFYKAWIKSNLYVKKVAFYSSPLLFFNYYN